MKDFAAIDFETANNERSSVCSVGVVIVRGGEVVDRFYSLIKPEPEYYNYRCSQVHGLCAADTDDAPVFPEVWKLVLLSTHNAEKSIAMPKIQEMAALATMPSCCVKPATTKVRNDTAATVMA